MENKEMKTTAELVCKKRGTGVVCKGEGVNGTYHDCAKCGWNPETEARRKRAFRDKLRRAAMAEQEKRWAELKALPLKHEDCRNCELYKAV